VRIFYQFQRDEELETWIRRRGARKKGFSPTSTRSSNFLPISEGRGARNLDRLSTQIRRGRRSSGRIRASLPRSVFWRRSLPDVRLAGAVVAEEAVGAEGSASASQVWKIKS
jgi:hypothetical protein